jgi:hypothetical protein
MANDETTDISPQAFARVQHERDELKAKMTEVTKALGDIQFRDSAYEHFRQAGVRDPFGAASLAMRDVTLRDVPAEKMAGKLDGWLEEQKALWAAPAAPASAEPAEPAPAPPRPSPYQGPNPAAPGSPATFEPIVAGSAQWRQGAEGKSGEERIAAVRRGEVVVPDIKR